MQRAKRCLSRDAGCWGEERMALEGSSLSWGGRQWQCLPGCTCSRTNHSCSCRASVVAGQQCSSRTNVPGLVLLLDHIPWGSPAAGSPCWMVHAASLSNSSVLPFNSSLFTLPQLFRGLLYEWCIWNSDTVRTVSDTFGVSPDTSRLVIHLSCHCNTSVSLYYNFSLV